MKSINEAFTSFTNTEDTDDAVYPPKGTQVKLNAKYGKMYSGISSSDVGKIVGFKMAPYPSSHKRMALVQFSNKTLPLFSDQIVVNKNKSTLNINEAFTGVQLSDSDAKKIAAVTKSADIELKGFAEYIYGQLEDELLSVAEVLAKLKSPDGQHYTDAELSTRVPKIYHK